MDDERVAQLADILVASHGVDAEKGARERVNRCRRRQEPEWAALWSKVAELIAKRYATALSHTPKREEFLGVGDITSSP